MPAVPGADTHTSPGQMPSKDSTGKRLGGTAQKKRAAANRQKRAQLAALAPALAAELPEFRGKAPPEPDGQPHALKCDPPPSADGVAAGVTWAATLQAKAAGLAAAKMDPARVRAIGTVINSISKVKAAAADSERAVRLALAYLRQVIVTHDEAPPAEPAGLVLWSFWRLAFLAHAVATQEGTVDDAQVGHQARALAQVASVQPQDAIDRLLKAAEAAATSSLRAVA